MEGYESEKETVEHIRKWWKENGTSIIAGLAIGLCALAGWRYWEHQALATSVRASSAYDVMQNFVNANNARAAVEQADVVIAEFPKSTYATMAELSAAQLLVDQGDTSAAIARLQAVLARESDDNFKHISRIRLGRLLLSDGKADEAVKLIQGVETGKYATAYAELRGDIMTAQGDAVKAGDNYREALAALPPEHAGYRQLLEMKLGYLGLPAEEGK